MGDWEELYWTKRALKKHHKELSRSGDSLHSAQTTRHRHSPLPHTKARSKTARVHSLSYAAQTNNIEECLSLIERGAHVNRQHGDLHQTPLHIACIYGSFEAASLLLSHNANINIVDGNGHTPLMCCMEYRPHGHLQVAGLLLAAGCNANAKTTLGRTALYFAVQHRDKGAIDLLSSFEIPGALEAALALNMTSLVRKIELRELSLTSQKAFLREQAQAQAQALGEHKDNDDTLAHSQQPHISVTTNKSKEDVHGSDNGSIPPTPHPHRFACDPKHTTATTATTTTIIVSDESDTHHLNEPNRVFHGDDNDDDDDDDDGVNNNGNNNYQSSNSVIALGLDVDSDVDNDQPKYNTVEDIS